MALPLSECSEHVCGRGHLSSGNLLACRGQSPKCIRIGLDLSGLPSCKPCFNREDCGLMNAAVILLGRLTQLNGQVLGQSQRHSHTTMVAVCITMEQVRTIQS